MSALELATDLADTIPDLDFPGAVSTSHFRSIEEPEATERRIILPKFVDALDITGANLPEKPPEVVETLLHKGSKMVVGGTSKSFKTWALLDLAISVASGSDWWGFPCKQGKVLYINYEIQPEFFGHRCQAILDRREIALLPGNLMILNLRGMSMPLEALVIQLIELIKNEGFLLIIFDPIYKALGGRDENKAGDIASLCNELERVAVNTGAAVAFGAHFSKGNQAAKESIDRIGGSGVFARDPDTILTMTAQDQEDNAFIVQATLRNHKPIDDFVVRWKWPIFERAGDLDPTRFKQPAKRGNGTGEALEAAQSKLLPKLSPLGATYSDWLNSARMPAATFNKYRTELFKAGLVKKTSDGTWIRVE